VNMNAGLRFSF